ncbi:hypothetical protein PC114_g439 [Phytophthora cactorum]|nr:hypothetical protein PC114_g439 [Phytophthora cactorum]KAG3189625.1 hypothetical protein C6341_g2135 [Phytophthora cactorum]
MNELLSYKTQEAAFKTRDLLRKTLGVIVDQLIETATTDFGKFVAEQQYMLEVTNMGLTMLAVWIRHESCGWCLNSFSQRVHPLLLSVTSTMARCTTHWDWQL